MAPAVVAWGRVDGQPGIIHHGEPSPLWKAIAAIDGRHPVRAHGNSAMSVWGEIIAREMKERKIGWPRATTIQRDCLIAGVMTRQR
jgi:hypothetical protein